ncbi:MAG TPA: DNA polymerase III subunit delta' [Tepidisphaeraceae bacterium]|jgi:DNA polymerase-3 subunit delta'
MLTFTQIFSQQSAISWLQQAYAADRLPHGLIFAGLTGVGKATTARALAALLLCENPNQTTPCGSCHSCTALNANTHPDYHVVTKELIRYHDKTGKSKGTELSINVVRYEIVEPAGHKSVMGRAKIFAIEQADLMTHQAQNALLKTLEEPYGRTAIILLTDSPGSLLATIRSRCQTLRFQPLPTEVVEQQLIQRNIDPALAHQAAELTHGSLGTALKWIEDGVISPAADLAAQIDAAFEGTPPPDLPTWLKKAAEHYAEKQLERDELSSKDQATREALTLYFLIAADRARHRLATAESPEELERACAIIDSIARAENYLDSNVNTGLVLQQLAIALEPR